MQATQKIWMDGQFVDWDKAQVHVLSHTLHYGLGVFEGIRCYDTAHGPAIFRLQDHLERAREMKGEASDAQCRTGDRKHWFEWHGLALFGTGSGSAASGFGLVEIGPKSVQNRYAR